MLAAVLVRLLYVCRARAVPLRPPHRRSPSALLDLFPPRVEKLAAD